MLKIREQALDLLKKAKVSEHVCLQKGTHKWVRTTSGMKLIKIK